MYKQSISQTQNQIRLDCVLIFADQNLVWEIDRAGKCPESIKMQRNKSSTPPTPPPIPTIYTFPNYNSQNEQCIGSVTL